MEVMFGIIRCHAYCLALNHLIILGKYFLYVNALNTISYCFDDFVSLVRNKINLEKYIAVTCNKKKEFENKWKFFCLYKIVLYPHSFIHYRAKRGAKCMEPRLNVIQIILRSFIHYRV